jgi:hypothetical protein
VVVALRDAIGRDIVHLDRIPWGILKLSKQNQGQIVSNRINFSLVISFYLAATNPRNQSTNKI